MDYHILFFIAFLFLVSCEKESASPEKGIRVKIAIPREFSTRVVDEDNLAEEQIIHNISLFFTEPGSLGITDKYIYTSFSLSGEYQLISLPVEPTTLLSKDIYVIANYDNPTVLDALASVDDLRDLHTPEVNKSANLSPQNGFCMYGTLRDFDFTNDDGLIATVPLVRTCTKLRITLEFPENPQLSTINSFLIQNAAKYTYVIDNPSAVLPQSDYFNFAAPIGLAENGSGQYTNITYVYDANAKPQITIYTHINNSTEQQEFTADLPIPQRNYLYDIRVEILENVVASARKFTSGNRASYLLNTTIHVYNDTGELIDIY